MERSLKIIIPLCSILIFLITSFTKEINFETSEEFADAEESELPTDSEEKLNFEENPYEYILSKVPEDFRENVEKNLKSAEGIPHKSCPYIIRSSTKPQKMRPPDVLGIGMEKCGTGSLSFLGCHPQSSRQCLFYNFHIQI